MTHLVVLSGGLDSTAALALVMDQAFDTVAAVSYDYGQRHRRELTAAAEVAHHFDVPHRVVNLTGLLHGSALLGPQEVPEGHYAEDSMKATVVQGRNLLMASVAIALSSPGDTLVVGVHAGDHPIYPDCRPDFWSAMVEVAAAYQMSVVTPFLFKTKAQVVEKATELCAPLELTWSCYVGGDRHCGRCGTCVERAEAFHLAGVDDPTDYEDPDYWRRVTA